MFTSDIKDFFLLNIYIFVFFLIIQSNGGIEFFIDAILFLTSLNDDSKVSIVISVW
jgi:hypothetical protein